MTATFQLKGDRPLRGSMRTFQGEARPKVKDISQHTLGYGGNRAHILNDDDQTPEEKLAMAIIQQAAQDLADPRVDPVDYATAVYFFRDPSPLYHVFEWALDLSEGFLERVRGRINGRQVVGVTPELL